jgi:murein L,D-transpeptidase YafK
LRYRPYLRALSACAAFAVALALAGCDTDGTPDVSGRHMQPLSDRLLADIDKHNMAKESPILVRIFKEESEFEVWKEDKTGRFALLRTYPICRWSGELGPKIKQGDRQAPEGFYTITPGQMNPNSNYYLAINIGFPNAYDRANDRTGQFLMIHGDCSSAGCYAMTDEQIAEIYALARESFFGGQKSFLIQAFPFRMTALNMAKHHNSPHMAFWRMLKQGYDHFEVTRREPKIDVCEKHYVFDAETKGKFSASERCPAYKVPQEIASAVRDKQRRDETQMTDLINRGVQTVPVRTGADGGMNPTFLEAVRSHGGSGNTIKTASGTIPSHVNPPGSTMTLASQESKPASAVQVASANSGISGFWSNLFGSKKEERPAAEPRAAQPATPPSPAPQKPAKATAKPAQTAAAAAPRAKPDAQPAEKNASPAASKPASAPQQQETSEPEVKAANNTELLKGAAPTMPSGGFENRFGAWR